MNTQPATIAAIATAPGEAGIAIVRVSGPDSLAIADRVFRCAGARPSARAGGTFVHGYVVADAGADVSAAVDEALLLVFRAPHSYTSEDVIEIQGHGGRVSVRRILRATLGAGARLAEPGEFTRRAFLNGRVDLLQAEAVLDLIRAQSDRAASMALEQLGGKLSAAIDSVYRELTEIGAGLEASLDFPEDDVPAVLTASVEQRISDAKRTIADLIATWEEGHLLREGAFVPIVGPPNVGKSTLMNALLGKERSIVTELPGTTRDTIEESIIVDGFPVRLVDTAGMREAACAAEREGVRRANSTVENADLVIIVADASQAIDSDVEYLLARVIPSRCIVVMNKTDLGRRGVDGMDGVHTVVQTSLVRSDDAEKVRLAIAEKLAKLATVGSHTVISERHRSLLAGVLASLDECQRVLEHGRDDSAALIASLVRDAAETLGAVNGRTYTDDLLSSIFSRFCIGK